MLNATGADQQIQQYLHSYTGEHRHQQRQTSNRDSLPAMGNLLTLSRPLGKSFFPIVLVKTLFALALLSSASTIMLLTLLATASTLMAAG